jgi:hypothetical protein
VSDSPVSFRWLTDIEALSFLGVAVSDATIRASVTHAYVVARNDPDAWISYSRRKCWYTGRQRYDGPHTYTSIKRAVDLLSGDGWIEHHKVRPGSLNKVQSTFRATAKLVDEMRGARVTLAASYEPIVLRDDKKAVKPYTETRDTRRMRANLARINGAIAAAQLEHPALGIIRPGDPTRFEYVDEETGEIKQTQSGPADTSLFRVFTGGFSLHGRFYGGFWQQWPEQERLKLTIDGGRVVEEDYSSIHPTLLYRERGLKLEGKPYDIPGIRRVVAKRALLVMLNARNRRDALRSLKRQEQWNGEPAPTGTEIDDAVKALEAKHRPISDAFYSDSGIRLMWHDARMAEQVMLDLLDQGIAALPIHDSFVVRAEYGTLLREIMEKALNKARNVTARQGQAANHAQRARQDRERGRAEEQDKAICGTLLRCGTVENNYRMKTGT